MSLSPTQFQTWQGDRYAYEIIEPSRGSPSGAPLSPSNGLALLLIHPIGVGLSRRFWDRFNLAWAQQVWARQDGGAIYNLDLLGCGESDLPQRPYKPEDWGGQLEDFLNQVVQRPVVLVAQGALVPAAIALCRLEQEKINAGTSHIKGLVLSGPPAWRLMLDVPATWRKNLVWGLLSSPLGALFYRYARRRQFLESFSRKQLFASNSPIDAEWIEPLVAGAKAPATRHAVFAFLSRFWQQGYGEAVAKIAVPTLVLFGDEASSVTRSGNRESPQDRVDAYVQAFPNAIGQIIPGRNVLPYESTEAFVAATNQFVKDLPDRSQSLA
ncbi:MAG: alpha/beta fold hydrolase [Synechococcales cyanobacterium CRU_2_2]|nr:alpha/beta fold hydrolase [Synechococcales cyanobacterium CRU_2_2]